MYVIRANYGNTEGAPSCNPAERNRSELSQDWSPVSCQNQTILDLVDCTQNRVREANGRFEQQERLDSHFSLERRPNPPS